MKTCIVCGSEFEGRSRATLCSDECRRARRRGRDAGVASLPPPARVCDVCGKEFAAQYGRKTCSPECLQEKKRARWREYWVRNPEKQAQAIQARKEKRAENPEPFREQERRKHRKERADPEQRARLNALARAAYHRRSEEIQAKRRRKREAASPEEKAKFKEQARKYLRRWRGTEVITGRTCLNCGVSIDHKNRAARFCTDNCRRKHLGTTRTKWCVECGQPHDRRKARVCSQECYAARRRRLAAERRVVVTPSERQCEVCGEAYQPTRPNQRQCGRRECALAWVRKWRKARVIKSSLPAKPCVVCGELFTPIRASATTCRKRECRLARKREAMRTLNQGRETFGDKERICVVCGRIFIGHSLAILCSSECRKRHITEADRKRHGVVGRRCSVCGVEMPIGLATRYTCSPGCRDKAKRRRQARIHENHPEYRVQSVERRRQLRLKDPAAYAEMCARWRRTTEERAKRRFTEDVVRLKRHIQEGTDAQD